MGTISGTTTSTCTTCTLSCWSCWGLTGSGSLLSKTRFETVSVAAVRWWSIFTCVEELGSPTCQRFKKNIECETQWGTIASPIPTNGLTGNQAAAQRGNRPHESPLNIPEQVFLVEQRCFVWFVKRSLWSFAKELSNVVVQRVHVPDCCILSWDS